MSAGEMSWALSQLFPSSDPLNYKKVYKDLSNLFFIDIAENQRQLFVVGSIGNFIWNGGITFCTFHLNNDTITNAITYYTQQLIVDGILGILER